VATTKPCLHGEAGVISTLHTNSGNMELNVKCPQNKTATDIENLSVSMSNALLTVRPESAK